MDSDSNLKLIENTALVAGVIWSQHDPVNFVKTPISSTFNGLIYGGLVSIGAGYVGSMVPDKIKPYFAGLIGVSAGCYLIHKVYQKITNTLPPEQIQRPIINIQYNSTN